MDLKTLIEETLSDIMNPYIKASAILSKAHRIAYQMHDLEQIIWLRMQDSNFEKDDFSSEYTQWFLPNLIEKFGQEKGKAIHKDLINEYKEIRTIEIFDAKQGKFDSRLIGIPLIEIEKQVEELIESKSENNVPQYYRNPTSHRAMTEMNRIITKELQGYNNLLSKIKNKLNTYLVSLEEQMNMRLDKMNNIPLSKNVFIIHGHDEAKWRELKEIVSELGLNPIVLLDKPSSTRTIIEKFEHYAADCSYAMAIFTPDDIVEKDGEKYLQARPNVVYEVGWFCGHLGRNHVCVIFQESKDNEIFTDFDGIIQIRFYKNIKEKYQEIQAELKEVGIL